MPKKVMIVEDNELNMKLFRDLIEASGYETVRTRNGLEALDLARAHKPDLILMDIQLPEVSGLEPNFRPTGFPSGKYFFAAASLMIATFGAFALFSLSVKLRPSFNGIPITSKKLGATTSRLMLSCCWTPAS